MESFVIDKIKPKMQYIWRQRRLSAFLKLMCIKSGYNIIDLGGTPELWEMIDLDLDITLLNLPDVQNHWQGPLKRTYRFVDGDACDAMDFADNKFDVVFSNAVIEHVGPPDRQDAFAMNVHRLAHSYWVQTPSLWFPIESHCNLPFWWFYPQYIKRAWIRRWQQQGREILWRQMAETRVLKLSRLKSLFPEAQVYTEYVAGFPKSYSMYRTVTK